MKRKLLMSSLVLAAAATLVGAGTVAQFSDTETSKDQTVSAGVLDIAFDGPESWNTAQSAPFDVINAKPGDSGSKLINIVNTGTLPLGLIVRVEKVSDLDNTCPEPESAVEGACGFYGELGASMKVSLDGFLPTDIPPTLNGLVARGDLMPWGAQMPYYPTSGYHPRVLAPNQNWLASVAWEIPEGIENEIQSDSVSWRIVYEAVQLPAIP